MTSEPADQFRLSRDVLPVAYRLRICTDLETLSFDGEVEIDAMVSAATRSISLNAVELEIDTADVVLDDGTVRTATVGLDAALERVTLALDTAVPAGGATVRLAFRGVLNERLVGFYRSTYTDADGAAHTIATTQFALTDARRAFPCFDEPDMKATFAVTLVADERFEVFSNSPVASVRALEGSIREVAFHPTMTMSSYLVAFTIGEFEQSETIDAGGVPLSAVCTPGKLHLTEFALKVAAFALPFYADYFGIAYPGEKVDLLAIPDFAYGAMENLGCITFRETALLVDPATASMRELRRVAMVVAHELAHMWFGDLVTMGWWEGIWLNEAFATFLQYVCVDAMFPEWKVWIEFAESRELGLGVDALHTTRAIEFPVHSPSDAVGMMDAITYEKGGAVLRMLEQYLGADTFRDGVREYLRRHAYANTETKDLWSALESVSDAPVGEIMNTWVLQGGHPIVAVNGGSLSQRPFEFAPASGVSNIGWDWLVPVLSRPLEGGKTSAQLLGDMPVEIASALPAIVNAGGSGVYRTSYDPVELEQIAGAFDTLSEIERAVLLGDTWALTLAGERSVPDVLTLARGLGTLVEPSSWAIVHKVLVMLDRIVDDATRPVLEHAARHLLAGVFDALGWDPADDEEERTPQVRATVIQLLGTIGADPAVRAEAAARFDKGEVDGDVADAIVATVGAMNRPGDYDEMVRRFTEATVPQAEDRYRSGLATIADAGLALSTFEGCFELFRAQDAPRVIAMLVQNRVAGRAVWHALTSSWDETLARVPLLLQSWLGVGVRTFVNDRAFAERVTAFHREHPLEGGQQLVDQAIEAMFTGVAFAERARPSLAEALAS